MVLTDCAPRNSRLREVTETAPGKIKVRWQEEIFMQQSASKRRQIVPGTKSKTDDDSNYAQSDFQRRQGPRAEKEEEEEEVEGDI